MLKCTVNLFYEIKNPKFEGGGKLTSEMWKKSLTIVILSIIVASSLSLVARGEVQINKEHQDTAVKTFTLNGWSDSKSNSSSLVPSIIPVTTICIRTGSANTEAGNIAITNEFSIIRKDISTTANNPVNTTYSVFFNQSGLYSTSKWYVNSTGSPSFNSSGALFGSKTSYSISLPNGSYSYTIRYGIGSAPSASYSESSYSSTVKVNGSSASVSVTFIPMFAVTFSESGLYSGSTWNVTSPYFYSGSIASNQTYVTDLLNSSSGYAFSVSSSVGAATAPALYSSSYTSPVIVNGKSGKVSITFTPEFWVTFTESGLPYLTKWYFNITGLSPLSSSNITVSTTLPNATYSYSLASTNKTWTPKTVTGNFKVNGASYTATITFVEVTYLVRFTESGLLSGTKWFLNISGQVSLNSTNTVISTALPNATYNYTISTSNKVYSPSPNSGSFKINGSSYSSAVLFSLVTYVITFSESGLPTSTAWYVNITGQPFSGTITSKTWSISLSNGSYFFLVETGNKQYRPSYNSPFIVNGSAENILITYELVVYDISFTQSGLYSGSRWYVNSSGYPSFPSSPMLSGSANSYSVSLPNGTYFFTIQYGIGKSPVNGYSESFNSSLLVVNGGAVSVHLTFTPLFNATFIESGLYSTSKWYVNSTGSPSFNSSGALSGLTHSYFVDLPNGSYFFTILYGLGTTSAANYSESNYISPLNVNGASTSISVVFTPLYTVLFTESSLPLLVKWEVNVGNQTAVSSRDSAQMLLPNGTHHYRGSILSNLGISYLSSGYFTIRNGSAELQLTFIPNTVDVILTFFVTAILVLAFFIATLMIKRVKR